VIRQQGHEEQIRTECQESLKALFKDLPRKVPTLSEQFESQIVAMAELTAIARTHVYRNSYGRREVEYVPEPEANTRISKGLAAIAKGIASINRRTRVAAEDVKDAIRVGMDCIPDYRRKLLEAAIRREPLESVPMPRTVRTREIEELKELTLIEEALIDSKLSDKARELLEGAGLLSQCVRGRVKL